MMALRKFSIMLTLALLAQPSSIRAGDPHGVEAAAESQQRLDVTALQARFAKLQQIARPHDLAFEFRLADEAQAVLEQRGDGIVRLPQDWVLAAPDGETLDFLMLLGLANAIAREPAPQGPSTATKAVTGTLAYIGANVADNRRTINLSAPHFKSRISSRDPAPALRALSWATATGACEARVVLGLQKLGDINGPTGRDTRQILKALGPVAWTPNDRCASPAD